MTDYIPGRIYSGIYLDGKRENFMWTGDHFAFAGARKIVDAGKLTDVRGPLVVLDLSRCDVPWVISQLVENTDDTYLADIAAQIEAQTAAPLQVGWHECVEAGGAVRPFWWDGEAFHVSPESLRPILLSVRSVAYLGKGTRA